MAAFQFVGVPFSERSIFVRNIWSKNKLRIFENKLIFKICSLKLLWNNKFDLIKTKVLYSGLIDSTFSKRIGRRKSWIALGHLGLVVVCSILSFKFEEWLQAKNTVPIAINLFLLFFFVSCQDVGKFEKYRTLRYESGHSEINLTPRLTDET